MLINASGDVVIDAEGATVMITYNGIPAPDSHRWCAYLDGLEEDTQLYGYADTPTQALRELADRLEEWNAITE